MDIIKEVMDLGMGIFVISKKKADKIVKELVKQGKVKQEEAKDLIEELVKRGKAEQKDFEKKISKITSQTLSKLNIATKTDIKRLEGQIRKARSHKH